MHRQWSFSTLLTFPAAVQASIPFPRVISSSFSTTFSTPFPCPSASRTVIPSFLIAFTTAPLFLTYSSRRLLNSSPALPHLPDLNRASSRSTCRTIKMASLFSVQKSLIMSLKTSHLAAPRGNLSTNIYTSPGVAPAPNRRSSTYLSVR